jgi:hypothetical protein
MNKKAFYKHFEKRGEGEHKYGEFKTKDGRVFETQTFEAPDGDHIWGFFGYMKDGLDQVQRVAIEDIIDTPIHEEYEAWSNAYSMPNDDEDEVLSEQPDEAFEAFIKTKVAAFKSSPDYDSNMPDERLIWQMKA